jgi:pyrimidine-specific ribonucleoside hydrolase
LVNFTPENTYPKEALSMNSSDNEPGNPTRSGKDRPIRLLVDCDTGVDDALALLYLARTPLVELAGVTCVAGNASRDQVVANTLAVLDAAGASTSIPVASGAESPLVSPARSAPGVHGENGIGGLDLPASNRQLYPGHAVELIRALALEGEEPLTLLALAPITNLALFVRLHPELLPKIERIVFMGGSASIGNATPVAEFNTWHDPEALHIVLEAPVPVTMYGLDVFYQPTIPHHDIERLASAGTDHATLAARLLRVRGGTEQGGDVGPGGLGDAGAAVIATRASLAETHSLRTQVALSGPARGQTIVDQRTEDGEDMHHSLVRLHRTIDVCVAVDDRAIAAHYLTTLLS